jgi:hypothetical protein
MPKTISIGRRGYYVQRQNTVGLVQVMAGKTPGSTIRTGTGAPNNAIGANGDYYFRTDGGAGTYIYFRAAGSYTAIL